MITISRFKFTPLSYDDYLKDYVNSLKTGEMLVDLTNHDIFVTEEGANIPIPTTKALRDKVVKFLETDLEGLKLQTNRALTNIDKLQATISASKAAADASYDKALNLDGVAPSFRSDSTFIQTVNSKTINQLGDLKINLSSLEGTGVEEKLGQLIAEFNRLNDSAFSGYYHGEAVKHNEVLLEIWQEISVLMDIVNQKADSLGSFSGSLRMKRNTTRNSEAYDCTYSRRLNNFTTWSYVGGLDQYVAITSTSQGKFEAWFRGEAYLDLTRADMLIGTERGTGLWYKNFPNKVDLATNSKVGRPHEAWDLFEVVPLSDYRNFTPGWNIQYLRSISNNVIVDLESQGPYASAGSWTTRLPFSKYSVDNARFGYGGDWWRQAIPSHGASSYTTSDSLMGIVANMNDQYQMQRTPKQTYHSGITSRHAPALATMTRAVPYYSSVGIANTDGVLMRLGLRKTLKETALSYASYQFNGSDWQRR